MSARISRTRRVVFRTPSATVLLAPLCRKRGRCFARGWWAGRPRPYGGCCIAYCRDTACRVRTGGCFFTRSRLLGEHTGPPLRLGVVVPRYCRGRPACLPIIVRGFLWADTSVCPYIFGVYNINCITLSPPVPLRKSMWSMQGWGRCRVCRSPAGRGYIQSSGRRHASV